jgi:DNA repair protein RadC
MACLLYQDSPSCKGYEYNKLCSTCDKNARLSPFNQWIAETHDEKITMMEDAVKAAIPLIGDYQKEYFILLCLDTKNGIIKKEVVSMGSLNSNVVHPRETFKPAILASAAHILVLHNHPSGDPTPSREDIAITEKLRDSGEILGITLLDHVIIGKNRNYSMKESGHI